MTRIVIFIILFISKNLYGINNLNPDSDLKNSEKKTNKHVVNIITLFQDNNEAKKFKLGINQAVNYINKKKIYISM